MEGTINDTEGGNGLPEESSSEVTPEPVVPTETEPVAPTATVQDLYDLPDGRKVDAATLAKEFKENFLPEFTRKSQELARLTTTPEPNINNKSTDPLADPDYVPQTYAEIIQIAKEATIKDIQAREQARIDSQKALETAVESQINEIKAVDPSLNENLLYAHATKYRFTDLKLAHQNMKDMSETIKKVQQTTAQNVQKRTDPVSVSHGATGARPDPAQFSSARDYLNAVRQGA